MTPSAKTIRREQLRQAKQIHGGLKNLLIALLGIKLARLPIPMRRLRASMFRAIFSKKYPPGINEDEAEKSLESYASLNALFTRGIKPECRPISDDASQMLCPCDGTVQDVGKLDRDKILTVKGIDYTLASLLPTLNTQSLENGHCAIVFLSPIDCHRIFSPVDGRLVEAIHIPGFRLLVHPPYQRPEYPVYSLNERMILRFATEFGPCVVVMVAGWGVGNITLPAAGDFRPHRQEMSAKTWPDPIHVKRGQWIATFELGSTAVLIAPPSAGVASLVSINQKVKYGQPLFAYPR
ncbi:MAG TPA: archaetidylserine decarboxylase [Gemmataceae bacterium]|nr:archaetidylserine decarboxylase [Gemmataceae bacterium]